MSLINANVEHLLIQDLDRTYENMAFGSSYSAIIGIFSKEQRDGESVKVPLATDFGPGMSATANTAYVNSGLVGRKAFSVDPFVCYGFSQIPLTNAILTTGDDQSCVDLLVDESQKAMDSCSMQLDKALAGDGSGCTFQIVSHSGSTPNFVLTLDSTVAVNGLTVGATYATKSSAFDTSLDTGTFTIVSAQAQAKTIAVTANSSWSPTDTHVGGLSGTVLASASLATWPGIPGWIPPPASRPVSTSDSFFTVNRSINETKLAGSYIGPVSDILEGINTLAYAIADVPGSEPDTVLITYGNLGKIQSQCQTQKRYIDNESKVKAPDLEADVFFDTVRIQGPKGKMDIVASSNWNPNYFAVLTRKTWKLGAPGNRHLRPATVDGKNPFVNIPGQDTVEAQYRCLAFVWCTAPGHNGMGSLS